MYYVGIDLGGTAIKVGLVDENGNIIEKISADTGAKRENEEIFKDMAKLSRDVCRKAGVSYDEIESIGLATPGLVQGDVIRFANNLGFFDLDAGKMLGEMTGKKVYVGNDANLAALGEALCGGGKGASSVAMLTLGTGLGMGIIIDGAVYVGANGGAGEFGHTIVERNGHPCSCGNKGCLECYTSATALVRMTLDAMKEHKESEMWKMCGGNLTKVSGQTAWRARDTGDKTAEEVVDMYTDYVSIAIANAVNTLQPEVVLIGGGVSNEGENLFSILRKKAGSMMYANKTSVKQAEIKRATLGNKAGMVGAAMFAKTGGKTA
ncbi:MAG: ROK family protein [Clostridia bacterium]|nr:ROK family protein [Clostridia bacterium]